MRKIKYVFSKVFAYIFAFIQYHFEYKQAGTGVYVGWYWSLCGLVPEFMQAGTAFEANILQAGYDEAFKRDR